MHDYTLRLSLHLFTGLQFWRVGSRKVYAVPIDEVCHNKRKRKRTDSDDDSESKKSHEVIKEIAKLRSEIRYSTVNSRIADALKCTICLSIVKPPVMYTHCCLRIVGCKECIDAYGQDRCPLCRVEKYKTTVILGLDDLLKDLASLSNSSEYAHMDSSRSFPHPYDLAGTDSDDDFV